MKGGSEPQFHNMTHGSRSLLHFPPVATGSSSWHKEKKGAVVWETSLIQTLNLGGGERDQELGKQTSG